MRLAFLLAPLLCATLPAAAETPITQAVAAAPSLQAALARADAAQKRAASAGRLPDPQLEGMYSQVRRPAGGEQFPMWEITLSQPLPKAGERAADRDRAAASLSMAEADYAVMADELAADTASALAEADAALARAELLQRQLARTRELLSALDARVATSGSRLPDRLALQTRLASLELMIEREQTMATDARAEARGRLGLPTHAPLPAYSAPAPEEIDPDAPPSLRLGAARADEARAMVRMARASARPMTAVGLRFEREEERIGNMDTIGVAFMTELPFRSRGYARAETATARAEERAALADADSARHRARAAVSRAERAERLASSTRRLAADTAARLDAEYDALVRANETTVTQTLDILDRLTDTRLQLIDADLTARAARAELWRHAPASLFQP
jgi:outer membrane protein TolC